MKRILLFINVLMLACGLASGQVQLAEQQPGTLFAYPLAPDTCSTLESRCNYIISHFWDSFDYGRPVSDVAAFEQTFRDYVDFFRYAHRNVVLGSVRDFVNKSQANSANLKLVGEVAERALYGAQAEYWSDEVYVAFAKPLAASKSLPKEVRNHYAEHLSRINAVQVGAMLDFEYVGLDGQKHRLSELTGAEIYVLLFVDDSTDSMIGRLRLSTDVAVNNWIGAGDAMIVCVSLYKYSADWATTAATWADNWTLGCSDALSRTLDLRALPCCYVLDAEHKIVNKSLSVDGLITVVNN